MLSHLLSRGGLVICSILISKYFNVISFSNYSYFILTVTTIANYSALGIGVTTTKFYAKIFENIYSSPVLSLGLLSLIFSFVGAFLFFYFSNLIVPTNISIDEKIMAYAIFFMCLDVYASNALIGLQKIKALFVGSLFSAIINLIAVITSILTKEINYSIVGILISVAGQFYLNLFMLYKYIIRNELRKILKIRLEHIFLIINTIGPMMFVSLIAASGIWVIGKFILLQSVNSMENFALFSIGLQWYSLALFIPTMLSKVILPYLFKNKNEDYTVVLRSNCMIIMIFCLFLAIVAYFVYPYIIIFYKGVYSFSPFYIPLFLILAGISACCNIMGNVIIASNREYTWLSIVLITFMVLIFICYLFKNIGSYLGVLALGVSNFTMLTIIIFVLNKRISKL